MRTTVCAGLTLFVLGMLGCHQAAPLGLFKETYSVEANSNQLVAGEKQQIEIVVRYHRSQQPPATLKYSVQLAAPADLTITHSTWDVEEVLTSNHAGFNHTGVTWIDVAPDAVPGSREVTVTITPAEAAPTSATLEFRVVKQDR